MSKVHPTPIAPLYMYPKLCQTILGGSYGIHCILGGSIEQRNLVFQEIFTWFVSDPLKKIHTTTPRSIMCPIDTDTDTDVRSWDVLFSAANRMAPEVLFLKGEKHLDEVCANAFRAAMFGYRCLIALPTPNPMAASLLFEELNIPKATYTDPSLMRGFHMLPNTPTTTTEVCSYPGDWEHTATAHLRAQWMQECAPLG